MGHTKKMAIVASYFAGETYGLLGPQMAATIIEDHTPYECIVIAVDRADDKGLLKHALRDYFGGQEPIIGFSTLSGRQDLFELAGELKKEGAVTILAGPQADSDFVGEKGWEVHPHRFHGVANRFSFAVHGPAEQIIGFLHQTGPRGLEGTVVKNPRNPWKEAFLTSVRWENLFRPGLGGLHPLVIDTAQVLQQIGCPHATCHAQVEIAYPAFLRGGEGFKVALALRGCSFCDVAVDKGFQGLLGHETVMKQIQGLPERGDGSKIAFELINENPLPGLPRILRDATEREIRLSQVNLTMRADWLIRSEAHLREALAMARQMRIRILLSSVGFESFDDEILRNLHKGLTVETNLRAVRLMRRLKGLFPFQWGYSKAEGAVHGFIHPTPWDTPETAANVGRSMERNRLTADILPDHSVPLIIHHASSLADWIREVEEREGVRFARYGSVVGWWEEALLKSNV